MHWLILYFTDTVRKHLQNYALGHLSLQVTSTKTEELRCHKLNNLGTSPWYTHIKSIRDFSKLKRANQVGTFYLS